MRRARETALAIAAHLARRGPLGVDELAAEFDRRGYHPRAYVVGLDRAVRDRLIRVDNGTARSGRR